MQIKINNGFTLIEVLIALAILSIAIIAIVKSSAQNIKDTMHLQNKTIATWIAVDVLNETQALLLKLPMSPDSQKEAVITLNQHWSWEANKNITPNSHIKEIHVTVFLEPKHEKLSHLVSYLYES